MKIEQEGLYKALEVIANGVLTLEDMIGGVIGRLTKEEVQEVVDKFTEEITDFKKEDMEQHAYDFEEYANTIISEVVAKLKPGELDKFNPPKIEINSDGTIFNMKGRFLLSYSYKDDDGYHCDYKDCKSEEELINLVNFYKEELRNFKVIDIIEKFKEKGKVKFRSVAFSNGLVMPIEERIGSYPNQS